MMRLTKWAAAAAAMTLLAQPCVAADFTQDSQVRLGTPAAFAGVKLNWNFGQRESARPTARLQLTTAQRLRNPVSGEITTLRPSGFEFGASKAGKPTLYFGGHDQAEFQRKLGLSGGTTALIVGGVLVGVIIIALAAGSGPGDTCPTYEGSRDHCINP